MNARAETVGQLRSYARSWREGKLCLVPMQAFFEPNGESGAAVRWKIAMADHAPFAVAGLYTPWREDDGTESFSFTQLTINADAHPLLRRFHRPGDEKRSLVIVPRASFDDWLDCAEQELARAYFSLLPSEALHAEPAPKARAAKAKTASAAPSEPAPPVHENPDLFQSLGTIGRWSRRPAIGAPSPAPHPPRRIPLNPLRLWMGTGIHLLLIAVTPLRRRREQGRVVPKQAVVDHALAIGRQRCWRDVNGHQTQPAGQRRVIADQVAMRRFPGEENTLMVGDGARERRSKAPRVAKRDET